MRPPILHIKVLRSPPPLPPSIFLDTHPPTYFCSLLTSSEATRGRISLGLVFLLFPYCAATARGREHRSHSCRPWQGRRTLLCVERNEQRHCTCKHCNNHTQKKQHPYKTCNASCKKLNLSSAHVWAETQARTFKYFEKKQENQRFRAIM